MLIIKQHSIREKEISFITYNRLSFFSFDNSNKVSNTIIFKLIVKAQSGFGWLGYKKIIKFYSFTIKNNLNAYKSNATVYDREF